jgi:hypothetical protein
MSDNPIPARTAAECIDRLRLEKEQLQKLLAQLMYWMDKAREGQPLDLDKFNAVYNECNYVLSDDGGAPDQPTDSDATTKGE